MTTDSAVPTAFLERVGRLLDREVASCVRPEGGYTAATRAVVRFTDGTSAFAKSGADLETSTMATWLREEHRWYEHLDGARFLPRLIAWEDGDEPMLVIEDLSDAYWPPPWSAEHIAAVRAVLDELAAVEAPAWAPPLEARWDGIHEVWTNVRERPQQFLSLGVASAHWLEECGAALVASARTVDLRGDRVVHSDVRSDNLCITGGGVKLVDWNWASRGSQALDCYGWLPALHREGGPPPWEMSHDSRGMAALLAGYFAFQAGRPSIPTAPRVRAVQFDQLRSALPWACRELGIPPPDGPRALVFA